MELLTCCMFLIYVVKTKPWDETVNSTFYAKHFLTANQNIDILDIQIFLPKVFMVWMIWEQAKVDI